MDEKKSFWATVPGILTGIGTVIAALTGLYIALHPTPNVAPSSGSAPLSISPPARNLSPSTWPLIAEDTFTKESSGWTIGSFPKEETPRFELRVVDGRYRWDVTFSRQWRSGRVYAPYGAMVNFEASIDVKIIDNTDLILATLHIGEAVDQIYSFNVSSNGQFSLTKVNPSGKELEIDLIGWTPISFKSGDKFQPNIWNRMMIVAEDQLIKLYVNSELQGEYRDITFRGGKVGLSVNMFEKGSAVIDFDNLELRRKP
jgi:hypothetical protein